VRVVKFSSHTSNSRSSSCNAACNPGLFSAIVSRKPQIQEQFKYIIQRRIGPFYAREDFCIPQSFPTRAKGYGSGRGSSSGTSFEVAGGDPSPLRPDLRCRERQLRNAVAPHCCSASCGVLRAARLGQFGIGTPPSGARCSIYRAVLCLMRLDLFKRTIII
jgi:hypothetical protein